MKAVRYDTFEGSLRLVDVPDPMPTPDGVVVKVGASGLCRSDWHGWKGHDADVKAGHESAGTVIETGKDVLSQVGPELAGMDSFPGVGVTVAVLD